jgi:hypothetical protein
MRSYSEDSSLNDFGVTPYQLADSRYSNPFALIEDPCEGAPYRSAIGNKPYFGLQPLLNPSGKVAGYELLFRAGWENRLADDLSSPRQIMINHRLFPGFEDRIQGRLIYLNYTHESLGSALLGWQLKSPFIEILDSVEMDEDVLTACRALTDAHENYVDGHRTMK